MGSGASYFLTPSLKEKEHEILNEARIHFWENGFYGMNSFYKRKMDSWKNVPLKFAVTGSSEKGRSSFMDMLRSKEFDVQYYHPQHKNIIEFYDLPGIETSTNFQTFCKNIGGLIKYDAFLIFCTSQLTNREIILAENFLGDFAMPFVFIEENVDYGGKSREKIDCLKNPINFVRSGSDIYTMKKDGGIYHLFKEITSKLIKRRKEYFIRYFNEQIFKNKEFSQQEQLIAEIKAVVNKRGVDGIGELYKELIKTLEKPELNLVITGNTGTGKSSFINAVRGLKANDPGAATVGIRETTKKPAFYQLPKMKEIMFHDVPGIGTPEYPDIQSYCRQINLHEYDAFLIFSKKRFTENDKQLAEKISKEFKKPFFFVRTNIDQDIKNNLDDFGRTEEETKQEIMNSCEKNLKGLVTNEDIFLIDNRAPDKHDFQRLKDSIPEKLLTKKNDDVKGFIIDSLTNESTEFVKLKANILRGTIPGTTRVLNFRYNFSSDENFRKMVIAQVNWYREEFDLPNIDSLKESDMELAVKNPYEFLRTCINDLEIKALKNCPDFE